MGRKTKHNKITTPELIAQINPENRDLINDFLEYCRTIDRSPSTINAYKSDLDILFVWCLTDLNNKFFIDWKKRDVQKLQNWLLNNNENSPARVKRLKAVLSSMSNYVENILDDEFPTFRNIINKIESPVNEPVREKTILSDDEVDNFLNVLMEQKQYKRACLVALAAFGGRRKAELCRFKVSDFDDDHLICDGALYRSDPIKTKGRGSRGKVINCYTLAKDFKPYFDAWMQYREENGIESEWLFPNPNNPTEQMNITTINSWYDSFSEIIGKPFYCHNLRHFFTSHLIRAGIPATVVKDVMNWQSVNMVDLYNDTSADETFAQYFGADGIKKVEQKSFNDM